MHDHAKVADHLTIGSILSYIASWLVDATPVLQALALVASIIAGICAAYYHIKRARDLK